VSMVEDMDDGTFRLKGLRLHRDSSGTIHVYGIKDSPSEGVVNCVFEDDIPWGMGRPPMMHLHGDGDVLLSGRAGVEYRNPETL